MKLRPQSSDLKNRDWKRQLNEKMTFFGGGSCTDPPSDRDSHIFEFDWGDNMWCRRSFLWHRSLNSADNVQRQRYFFFSTFFENVFYLRCSQLVARVEPSPHLTPLPWSVNTPLTPRHFDYVTPPLNIVSRTFNEFYKINHAYFQRHIFVTIIYSGSH